jgi:small ligand-binding sensory domain FIST
VPFKVDKNKQSFYLSASSPVGTKLWLFQRDEELIFAGLDSMVARLVKRLNGRKPLAVFHTDCAARGRLMFNRILKDEIVLRMQHPLCRDGDVPWLGLYGFGEITRLGGRSRLHAQTTSLYVIVKKTD